ncbi:hypothetical protein CUS61_04135 [Enterococcus faecalis]|nr:hypothetical protein CUM98_01955 [Enterococcus faecalis]PQF62616.1 hypothetical protein CUS61_04135 [Enterococcus faecalis]PQG11552.1 hypothetical protein CUS18_05385 [Enterococcus faecalis]
MIGKIHSDPELKEELRPDGRRPRGICEAEILCGAVPVHGRRQPAMMSHPPYLTGGYKNTKNEQVIIKNYWCSKDIK